MNKQERLAQAEAIVGHRFSDRTLLEHALTHPSACENQPVWASYERLEFLGDSILGAIIAHDLYLRFPEMDEGALTRLKISLVSGRMLSMVARDLGIAPLILLGDSERGTGSRGMHSALENVFESLVGALYLDGGLEVARHFALSNLAPHIHAGLAATPVSPKSMLQELTQQDMHESPEYEMVGTDGPPHQPIFTCVVRVSGRRMGRGTGASKKAAETAAAVSALKALGTKICGPNEDGTYTVE